MTTFFVVNYGCRASQADGAALKGQLLELGFVESTDTARSDVAILNTCTVTAAADAEIRQTIRRIHRGNPRCKVMVTGCYAQRAPDELRALEGVRWIVGNSHKHQIPSLLAGGAASASDAESRGAREHDAEVWAGEVSPQFHFLPVFPDDRTRPTLKVQDGCNARCSFCVIPSVRGRSRSLSPDQVIEQIQRLEASGYKELVLSGINIGSYGRDLGRTVTFFELVERILRETRLPRLRISSIEPMDVTPALVRLAASEPRLADHFHIPLQSGCDRILRQMNRRYWAAQYAERVLAIRETMPHCAIGADVMTGFPGETAEDHAESARFIESLPFTYLHIFPFSARPGTPAAARADQANGSVAHERGRELRALIERKRGVFLIAQLSRTLSVLTITSGEDGALAVSSNYLNVSLPGSLLPPNQLVDVRVTRIAAGHLSGYADSRSSGRGSLPMETTGPHDAGHRAGNLSE